MLMSTCICLALKNKDGKASQPPILAVNQVARELVSDWLQLLLIP